MTGERLANSAATPHAERAGESLPGFKPRSAGQQPTIRAELAAAVRAVNAAFGRLPAEAQDALDVTVDGLEREIDAAVIAEDRERAMRAIRAWRGHWLHRIARAGR